MGSRWLARPCPGVSGSNSGRIGFPLDRQPTSGLPWSGGRQHPSRWLQKSQPFRSERNIGDPIGCRHRLAWPASCAFAMGRTVVEASSLDHQHNLGRTTGIEEGLSTLDIERDGHNVIDAPEEEGVASEALVPTFVDGLLMVEAAANHAMHVGVVDRIVGRDRGMGADGRRIVHDTIEHTPPREHRLPRSSQMSQLGSSHKPSGGDACTNRGQVEVGHSQCRRIHDADVTESVGIRYEY